MSNQRRKRILAHRPESVVEGHRDVRLHGIQRTGMVSLHNIGASTQKRHLRIKVPGQVGCHGMII